MSLYCKYTEQIFSSFTKYYNKRIFSNGSTTDGQGQVASTCDCGDEPSDSIKCGEFLEQPKTGELLKKDFTPWSK